MRLISRRFAWPVFFVAGMFLGSAVTAPALSYYQANMQSALGHLNAAYADLQAATADKGGYRAKAMNDIQDAIANVHRGVHWANTH